MPRTKVKVKIMADATTAPMLRDFVDRMQSPPVISEHDVQIAAWLLEVARAIDDELRGVSHVPR